MRHTENASLNPKHKSRTKSENPLLQHTKARGFLFVVGKFTGGVGVSPTTNALKICPDDSATIRLYFPTRRWADAHSLGISGVLTMLIQELSTKVKKKEPCFVATQNRASCAHGSARFALQGVRRSRPRWELFGLISLRRFVGDYRVGLTSMISEVNYPPALAGG